MQHFKQEFLQKVADIYEKRPYNALQAIFLEQKIFDFFREKREKNRENG